MKLSEKAFPTHTSQLAFAHKYANWNGVDTVMFSSDIDFVPDYMIQHLLDIIEPFDVKWTFFVTHDSPILSKIAANPNYELAIHPFCDPSSSQGANYEEILDNLLSYCRGTNVVGSRFHRLGHAYRDLQPLSKRGIQYDVSGLRLNLPYVLPAWHRDLDMLLISFTWEDGTFEATGSPMNFSSVDLKTPGTKIFSFHPINVWINGPTPEQRLKFFKEVKELITVPFDIASKYQLHGDGSAGVLKSTLSYLKENNIKTMKIADYNFAYREEVLKKDGVC